MWLHSVGLIVTLVLGLLVPPLTAEAQQARKVYRIGWLSAGPPPLSPLSKCRPSSRVCATWAMSRARTSSWSTATAEGRAERLRDLAAELVQLPVDVMVAGGASGTRGAQHATRTIPIVMTGNSDPVGQGFVASLARPGGTSRA